MTGRDGFGYTMLHKAIKMAKSIGIVNGPMLRLQELNMSEDMVMSLKRTAIVHTNFLRESHIKNVSVDRIDRGEAQTGELWLPYPVPRPPRLSLMGVYFDEPCKLSHIARNISVKMALAHTDKKLKQEMYSLLRQWDKELPRTFAPSGSLSPYIMILRMRYHTLVINLCSHDIDPELSSVRESGQYSNPVSVDNAEDSIQAALSSARDIAFLVQLYRTEYGMDFAHPFVIYFLPITRHLFYAFKESIRSQTKGERLQNSDHVPSGIKELFEPSATPDEPDKWNQYAERLAKADGEETFLRELGMHPVVPPGLHGVLEWYESLSIGSERPMERDTG